MGDGGGGGYTHMCATVYVHVLIMNLYACYVCALMCVCVYVKKCVYISLCLCKRSGLL